MSHLSIFRELGGPNSRLGFYTKETALQIPVTGGCYAWFLPLWFYYGRDDLPALLSIIGDLLSYEPEPEKELKAPFNWERVDLRVRRHVEMTASEDHQELWRRLVDDGDTKEALQRTLLEASLLMPPLYIGRAENLKRRHRAHTRGDTEFHKRFTSAADRLSLMISVEDLLFVCIKTPDEMLNAVRNSPVGPEALNALIERVLMQICRPPFSLR